MSQNRYHASYENKCDIYKSRNSQFQKQDYSEKTFPDHWEHHATYKLLFTRREKKMF